MPLDDNEPPGHTGPVNPTTRRTSAFLLLIVLALGDASTGVRVSNLSVLGYTATGRALVQLEVRNSPKLKLRSLEVGVSEQECSPPFITGVSVDVPRQGAGGGAARHQPVNLNLLLPTDSLSPDQFNRTFRFCVKINRGEWTREFNIFFPVRNSENTLSAVHSKHEGASVHIARGVDSEKTDVTQKEEPDSERSSVERDNLFNKGLSEEVLRVQPMEEWEQLDWKQLAREEGPEDNLSREEGPEDNLSREEGPEDDLHQRGRVRREDTIQEHHLQLLQAHLEHDSRPRIYGLSLQRTSSHLSYTETGTMTVQEGEEVNLVLIGQHLSNLTSIRFTTSVQDYGEPCGYDKLRHSKTVPFQIMVLEDGYGNITLGKDVLKFYDGESYYFICVQDPLTLEYIHQGSNQRLQIEVYQQLLPMWLVIVFIAVLLCLSGLFSGLNLGLMSLDQTELRILINTGSDVEKAHAKAIMPVRGMGNFLLCSILLGNVLVNNTLTVLLDSLTGGGGVVAIIGATLAIVIFGEIVPQAVCSRHGLAVGAHTIWLTKFFMLVTSPLAFPISKLLDKILGAEIGTVYNRERLMELIKVTDAYTDLEKDEVNIVTGALVLKRKTVKDVMTNLDDCYMLPLDAILDFETIHEIKEHGYSRIPVYEGERANVRHILFAKDLLFIDPDDRKPLEEVCKFYKNDVNFVYQDTILTDMFDEFKSGDKGHMALVQEANTEGDGDPYYETIGLLTLEDIIEEIIQQEINDETDVILDNKTKKKRKKERAIKDADFKMFLDIKNKQGVHIAPQVSLAILQFLTTTVKAFMGDVMSPRILQKLLNMDVYREIKLSKSKEKKKDKTEEEKQGLIMLKGKPCDFFVLIVEGRVQVTIGKEDHKFIEGPFSTFGEQMLEQAMLLPSSPMVSDPSRGTTHSLSSMHSSATVGEVVPARTLKKTNTLVQLETANHKRSGSADNGLQGLGRSNQYWVPDYTVRASSDTIYLKIRKATYMVALKAGRMNSTNSESDGYNDKELDYALERVTEDANDDEYEKSTGDKYWMTTVARSTSGTPTDMRRESLRSSFSMMKNRFLGGAYIRSSNSIDKNKDEFWDGTNNPACDNRSDDVTGEMSELNVSSNSSTVLGSSPGGLIMNLNSGGAVYNSYNLLGDRGPPPGAYRRSEEEGGCPVSLPLTTRKVGERLSTSEPNGNGDLRLRKNSGGDGAVSTVITVLSSTDVGVEARNDSTAESGDITLDQSQLSPTDMTRLLGRKS